MALHETTRRGMHRSPIAALILFLAIAIQPAWSWKCALLGAAVGAGLGVGIGAIAHSDGASPTGEGMAYGTIGAAPGFIVGGLLCGEEEEAVAAVGESAAAAEVGPIGTIYFDFDKYNIRPDQVPVVDDVAAKMQADPAMNVDLQGNTDSIGSEEYNLALGNRRSVSVQRALEERGVGSERMATSSFGEERPVAPNTNPDGSDNPAGRALNRRTDVVPTQ
jgi:outer membrane protein OmpA-like peptidoglycan-associated protein